MAVCRGSPIDFLYWPDGPVCANAHWGPLAANEHEGVGNMSENDKMPFMQQLLDSPLLLLTIGVVVPMVLYVVWGVMEVIAIPLAP